MKDLVIFESEFCVECVSELSTCMVCLYTRVVPGQVARWCRDHVDFWSACSLIGEALRWKVEGVRVYTWVA